MGSVRKVVLRWAVILSLAFTVWAFVLPGGLPFQVKIWQLERALNPVRTDFPDVRVRYLTNRNPNFVRYTGSVRNDAEKARLLAHMSTFFSNEESKSLCYGIKVVSEIYPQESKK